MRWLWLVLLFGGCRGCVCTNAVESLAESPPNEEVERQTRMQLEKDPETLHTICGVPADALKNLVVKVTKQTLGISTVHVEGEAVMEAGAAEAGIDVSKALKCAAVLTVTLAATLGTDGKRTGWSFSSLEIESVETAGVSFDKVEHAEHHHHHHHHH